jgi:hypothetical protein
MWSGLLRPGQAVRRTSLVLRGALGERSYRKLSEEELRATRSSDVVFVFGSGRSLVDISPDEWVRIAEVNTISLREFPRQQWVRADYHLTAEIDLVDEYTERIRANPLYTDTVFVVQKGWLASSGNEVIARGLLPANARLFRFSRVSRGMYAPPSRSFGDGIVHGYNSITDSVNFAYLMGWRRIVLAGVDLYNKEYFWLPPGEARPYEKEGIEATDAFGTSTQVIEMFGKWRDILRADGVELEVYNPKSLLAGPLDVFRWTS